MHNEFNGFPKQCAAFFTSLKKNNNKEWFAAHRPDYDEYVLKPAREFVSDMGEALSLISPGIMAIPEIDKSIFRIYKDVRFSKDKAPLKTNLALWFWEGQRKRMECSGYYVHLEPPMLMLGVGIYMFPKDLISVYRDSLVHPTFGKEINSICKSLRKKDYNIGGSCYKKVPRGYENAALNLDLLLHNGLYAGIEMPIPAELHNKSFIKLCMQHFKKMQALHVWLRDMTLRAGIPKSKHTF